MKKQKTVEIQTSANQVKRFTVSELTVLDIKAIYYALISEEQGWAPSDLLQFARDWLPLAVNAAPEELLELAPSELELLWEAWKEVNQVFLKTSAAVGISGLLARVAEEAKNSITKALTVSLSSSWPTAIPAFTNTDTACAVSPSRAPAPPPNGE
jgi:hypothetical protein